MSDTLSAPLAAANATSTRARASRRDSDGTAATAPGRSAASWLQLARRHRRWRSPSPIEASRSRALSGSPQLPWSRVSIGGLVYVTFSRRLRRPAYVWPVSRWA